MKSKARIALLLFSTALVLAPSIVVAEDPMEAFGALVEGRWTAGDSRHEFEWGVGRRAVRARSYYKTEQGWTLVGEGMWFWDPAQEVIRGVVVATAMPIDLFEYRSEVQDNEIVHDLAAHGPAGGKFVESWRFAGDEYHWTLEGGPEPMTATYRRDVQ